MTDIRLGAWLAQAVFIVALLLSVDAFSASGADSGLPEKSAHFKDAPGKLQLLPVRRGILQKKSPDSIDSGAPGNQEANVENAGTEARAKERDNADTEAEEKPAGEHDVEGEDASAVEKAARARQKAVKLRQEEQERKARERAAAEEKRLAAREAAAAAKEEAALARREAGKQRKEEEQREDRERAAARAEREAKAEYGKGEAVPDVKKQDDLVRDKRAPGMESPPERAATATPGQIQELAYKAGLYAYPLVLADAVRQADARAVRQSGDVDMSRQFFHSDTVPDHARAHGILQRADSLYSLAWLDLKNSPYLLEIPAMPDRYYLLQMLDAWTKNIPAISSRETDGKNGQYIILMRGAQIPAEYVDKYTPIFCPTSLCMLLLRIQVRGPNDLSAARAAQRAARLSALFPDKLARRMEDSDTAPVRQLAALDAGTFLSRFTGLLADNPAPDQDAPMMKQLARLEIEKGKDAFFALNEHQRKAAADGCVRALAGMGVYFNNMSAYDDPMDLGTNGWKMSVLDVGSYGQRYDMRSHLAAADFGRPRSQDMLQATLRVDANGKFLDGEQNYELRFAPGQLPPVEGFWSLTLYTAKQQLNRNKMQRYALTDANNFTVEADGSIVIYIQPKDPGGKYRANWLPTPTLGYFSLVLRLYAPKQTALSADWQPPKIMPGKRRTVWDSPTQSF